MSKGLLLDSNQKYQCGQLEMGRGWFNWKSGASGVFWNVYSQIVHVSQQRESMQRHLSPEWRVILPLWVRSVCLGVLQFQTDFQQKWQRYKAWKHWARNYQRWPYHFLLWEAGPVITLLMFWFLYLWTKHVRPGDLETTVCEGQSGLL